MGALGLYLRLKEEQGVLHGGSDLLGFWPSASWLCPASWGSGTTACSTNGLRTSRGSGMTMTIMGGFQGWLNQALDTIPRGRWLSLGPCTSGEEEEGVVLGPQGLRARCSPAVLV